MNAAPVAPLPRLFVGKVMHKRLRPVAHDFVYPVFFLSIPLGNVAALENRWLKVNRRGLFSFHFADHGARDGSHPLAWVRALLAREGVTGADGEVWLQTFPRVLGYVFNPVSFWFCRDRGGALRAVVAEVNNTFGERHCYLLAHPDGRAIAPYETLAARKVFHVSPFFPVAGGYRFRFAHDAARSLARIEYHDEGGDLLHTAVSGTALPYEPAALRRLFVSHRWMTAGVIARIHWQALRLWLKRVPFFRKPAPPTAAVTGAVREAL